MKRRSFCEWMPMLPWPMWPLAEHARLGQNTVVGSMTILLSWLCWGACQEKVCLDPRFLCNLTPPRFSVELPCPPNPLTRMPFLPTTSSGASWHDFVKNLNSIDTPPVAVLGSPLRQALADRQH